MRKRDELKDPNSCMNRARDDEWTFVLLGRDAAAPGAVWDWIKRRLGLGKNKIDDPQIVEALEWIRSVEAEQSALPIETTVEWTDRRWFAMGRRHGWTMAKLDTAANLGIEVCTWKEQLIELERVITIANNGVGLERNRYQLSDWLAQIVQVKNNRAFEADERIKELETTLRALKTRLSCNLHTKLRSPVCGDCQALAAVEQALPSK